VENWSRYLTKSKKERKRIVTSCCPDQASKATAGGKIGAISLTVLCTL